jgi:hypothetical protein
MHAYKLGHLTGDVWAEHSHAATFNSETTNTGRERLSVGVPAGDPTVFRHLVQILDEPFHVLYVLHTPRGEGEPGRYQASELDHRSLEAFLKRFSAYFSCDARFDLWVHSPNGNATLVWDRHNLIYAYGPLERFESSLLALGFQRQLPIVPFPHQHHYRQEFDQDAAGVLAFFDWVRSPLRPEDEQ